jgi:hypothetical protein
MRNPGYLLKTDNDETAIAYHKDQKKEFEALGKVCITVERDGKSIKIIKAKEKLKVIGFTD